MSSFWLGSCRSCLLDVLHSTHFRNGLRKPSGVTTAHNPYTFTGDGGRDWRGGCSQKPAASKGGAQVQKIEKSSGFVHLHQPSCSYGRDIPPGWEPTGFPSGESTLLPSKTGPLSIDVLQEEITSDFGFPKSQLRPR